MTEILDEAAVSEIEKQSERCLSFLTFGEPTRGNRYVETVGFYFEENADAVFDAFDLLRHVPALCATVKHLREDAKSKKIELLQLSGRGELLAKEHVKFDELDEVAAVRNEFDRLRNIVIVDLQSQLEQLRTIAEGALQFRVAMNGSCNHDEYMTKLCTQCEIRAALEKL